MDNNHRKIFVIGIVVATILCYLVAYFTWPKKVDKQQTTTSQATTTSAITNKSPSSGYEPSNPDEKTKVEKLVGDFTKAFVNVQKGLTQDAFNKRLEPYLTPDYFKTFNIPPANNTVNIIKGPDIFQVGDYTYRISFTVEEYPTVEAPGYFPTDTDAALTVTVDKASGLISDVKL